jgi:hypothetical protein
VVPLKFVLGSEGANLEESSAHGNVSRNLTILDSVAFPSDRRDPHAAQSWDGKRIGVAVMGHSGFAIATSL